jgi:hypothetical protein
LNKDCRVLDVLSKAFLLAYKAIHQEMQLVSARQRSFQILNGFKSILPARKHICLAKQLMQGLPQIFGFQACGVTFVDMKSQDLFSINFLTKD